MMALYEASREWSAEDGAPSFATLAVKHLDAIADIAAGRERCPVCERPMPIDGSRVGDCCTDTCYVLKQSGGDGK